MYDIFENGLKTIFFIRTKNRVLNFVQVCLQQRTFQEDYLYSIGYESNLPEDTKKQNGINRHLKKTRIKACVCMSTFHIVFNKYRPIERLLRIIRSLEIRYKLNTHLGLLYRPIHTTSGVIAHTARIHHYCELRIFSM